jgi:hypothetical protein
MKKYNIDSHSYYQTVALWTTLGVFTWGIQPYVCLAVCLLCRHKVGRPGHMAGAHGFVRCASPMVRRGKTPAKRQNLWGESWCYLPPSCSDLRLRFGALAVVDATARLVYFQFRFVFLSSLWDVLRRIWFWVKEATASPTKFSLLAAQRPL